MIKYIRKRDGRLDNFDINKIALAIYKSLQATDSDYDYSKALEIANDVFNKLEDTQTDLPTVELIQDIVEETLIEKGYIRTAKAYILYRAERTRFRDRKSQMMKTLEEITYNKDENINHALNDSLHQDFYDENTDIEELVKESTHIHINELFKDGFTVGTHVFREPNSISTYAALTCIAVESFQREQSNGQMIVDFDSSMKEGVKKSYKKHYYKNLRKCLSLLTDLSVKDVMFKIEALDICPAIDYQEYLDKEKEILSQYLDASLIKRIQTFTTKESYEDTDKETYQAMEALVHNLNTMSSRSTTSFVSIEYGNDTSKEARMVTKNVLLVTKDGVGNGETPLFPIQIFKVEEGKNAKECDKNYDLFLLAQDASSTRLFPYFSYINK